MRRARAARRDGRPGRHAGGMAHFLGAAGLDVWLADLRHHGDSAREPRRGAWTFEDWVLNDTPTLVARVREETDGAPLAWIGHSAGGAAGLCWLARVAAAAPLRAIVTLGTPGPRRLGLVRRTLAATTIALSRVLGRFPARALGVGAARKALAIEPGLSHRGLVVSEQARRSCWPNMLAWLQETL